MTYVTIYESYIVLTIINRNERVIYCNNVNIWLVGSRTHNKAKYGWWQVER